MNTEQTPFARAEAGPSPPDPDAVVSADPRAPAVEDPEPAPARSEGDAGDRAAADAGIAEDRADAADRDVAAANGGQDEGGGEGEGGDERWTAFAPEPERAPGRMGRLGARLGRTHAPELILVCLASVLVAVLMTWPTLRYPQYTIPQDIWDPTLQAWQMAWGGHALLTDPAHLWHANAFFPERFSYAFSDSLLGYAPAGMIGSGPVDAILRYNIIYVLLHALAFVGAYALVRQLGAGRTGAAVAGVAFAYAPWRLAQAGHLHVISTGGIALALAMLARGHGWSLRHGFRPERRRPWWAFAGWLVAAWQVSLGFGIGLPFAYVLAVIVVVAVVTWWIRRTWFWAVRRPFGGRLLLADLLGGAIFATAGALLALPYFKVADLHPYAKRTVDDLELFSSPLKGFFVAPGESRIWGGAHAAARADLAWPAETTLLPGFVLYGLAAAGLVFSIWKLWQRLALLAGVVVSVALGMGTRFFGGDPGYVTLFEHLPGWDGIRTPGRLVLWTTLLLGILAAGAVCAFVERARETNAERGRSRLGPLLRLATLVPLALVLVEGLNATPHPIVPRQPAAMRQADGPTLVLPTSALFDMNVMLWSTDRFVPIANGGSGFTPSGQAELRQVVEAFPDAASVDYLQELGVRSVILLPSDAGGTPWEGAQDRPVDGLGVEREEVGDGVVFRLP